MNYLTKSRVAFDFECERRESYDKLVQIVCSSHWASGIDIFGIINERHSLLFELVKIGAIVIDECKFKIQEPLVSSETSRAIKSMLGKRSNHPVLCEMAVLFGDEPFEVTKNYRNTIYLPNLNAYVRADGMKPEDVTDMLLSVDKIILFPYYELDDGMSVYYELTLGVERDSFIDFMDQVEKRRTNEMFEAIRQADKRRAARYGDSQHGG
jgi:hypothetical protein